MVGIRGIILASRCKKVVIKHVGYTKVIAPVALNSHAICQSNVSNWIILLGFRKRIIDIRWAMR